MKKILIILIVLLVYVPHFIFGEKKTVKDVQLSDEAFIKEIQQYYPQDIIEIFNSSNGRFATVFHDSTYTFALSTADHSAIKGYKGYSNLIIFVEIESNIEKIVFVDSDDTKPWVKKVLKSDILQELARQKITSEDRPTYLVTGATVTSKVFNQSVIETLDWFKNIFPQLKIEKSTIFLQDSLNK